MSPSNIANPSLGVSLAAFTATALLSIPHIRHLIAGRRILKPYQPLCDEETTTTSKSPQSRWQRLTVLVVSAVTVTATISWSSSSANPRAPNVLQCASWVLIFVQESGIAVSQKPQDRYSLGCYSALASLLLAVSIVLTHISAWHKEGSTPALISRDAFTIVQLVALFILLFVNLTFPRGPTAYCDGRLIDRQDSVSFLNRYTFSWAYSTLSLAAKNGHLNTDDLPLINKEVRAKTLSDAYVAVSAASSRWKKWLTLYWRPLALQLVIQLFTNAVHFLPHLILLTILRLFEERDVGANNQLQLWLAAIALGVSMLVVSWCISLRDFVGDLQLSLPLNEQLFAIITRKAMNLKDVALPPNEEGYEDEAGEEEEDNDDDLPRTKHSILNLLGVDVETISDFLAYSHLLLDCVLELTITIVFLVYLMGWESTVAGCAVPFLLTPVYYYLTKQYSKREQALMERRDQKSAALTEMVRGIREVKFSALESEWYSKILKLRGREMGEQRAVFRLNVSLSAIWMFGPLCMSFLSIATHIYVAGAISPSIAFTALSVFENLSNILSILPEVFTDLLDALVSIRRVERFLDLVEHQDKRVTGDSISFRNATITWPSAPSQDPEGQFHLRDLDMEIPSERLTVVCGQSGSGKSLLLRALIGEAEVVKGAVVVPRPVSPVPQISVHSWIVDGLVAYVSQDPWIENATIREAVLFGLPFNPVRYEEVISACSLSHDLKLFPDGEKTDIGANGVNLSGGQKWRLALARALYSRASILVLDDIFSAVDSHVGRHLYENALMGRLSEGRTRILATHHVRLCLEGAACLVKLENGVVVKTGHPDTVSGDRSTEGTSGEGISDISPRIPERTHNSTTNSESNAKKYYEEEKRARGMVKADVYKEYMRASGGYFHWVVVVLFFVAALLLNLAVPYWISLWTRAYDDTAAESVFNQPGNISNTLDHRRPRLDRRLVYYGAVYLGLSIMSWLLDIIRSQYILNGSLRASKVLFERFTEAILRAPLHFLDTTPVGQVLNRFTSDFGVLDSDLALNMAYLIHSCIMILGVIVAALFTSPVVVGLGALSLLAAWLVAYLYVTGAREAKRMESTAKSPIFELVGSLLTGLPTVRAFGREKDYLKRMYDMIDIHCQALWHRRLFASWMAFWLSMVGAVFVAFVTMIFVSIRNLDAPLAGFALSFALEMSDHISWLLSNYAQLELDFNATERIVEYTRLTQEPQHGVQVPAAWPTKGEIKVADLHASYAPDLPPVLRGLTLSIQAGERIGIVGRTGAGKSSLAMAFLRCLEIRSGSIQIDGVDIARIRLHDLRSRIGLIAQDPVVFAGTVREVLDPFNRYDDTELLDALGKISLLPSSSSSSSSSEQGGAREEGRQELSLSFSVAEGGRNLSQGQRQLLCLARALVSRPKILIMDEATASVDMESDVCIQRTLREEVSGCTLLVIAHRLSTIADFDRVVVLERGEVVEMGRPAELMELETGVFRGLVEESGERGVIEKMIFGG